MSEIRRTRFHDISTSNHGERGAPPFLGGDISYAPAGRVSVGRPGNFWPPAYVRGRYDRPWGRRGCQTVAPHRLGRFTVDPMSRVGPRLGYPRDRRVSQMISIKTRGLRWAV
jgi:hypothetical protein